MSQGEDKKQVSFQMLGKNTFLQNNKGILIFT